MNQSQANITKYVLKPCCVYSRLLLRCFIDHNISFGNHITLNLIETRRAETCTSKPAGSPSRYVRGGRKRPETPDRLQAVQNVLTSVVDIGAKTDYDATETRMLKRACCHGAPSRFGKRKVCVSVFWSTLSMSY